MPTMNSHELMAVHFTHVEDGLLARQSPFLTFWGQNNRANFLHMEHVLSSISSELFASQPPSSLRGPTGEIVFVFHQKNWLRARVLDTSTNNLVEVFCIDLGTIYSIPLSLIRTQDVLSSIPETVMAIKNVPLAQKYILADVSRPQELWQDKTMRYVRGLVENRTWKVVMNFAVNDGFAVQMINERQEVLSNLLTDLGMVIPITKMSPPASLLQERQLGQYSLPTRAPSVMRRSPTVTVTQTADLTASLGQTGAAEDLGRFPRRETVPYSNSTAAAKPTKQYVAWDLKPGEIHEVKVCHVEEGVRKFTIQVNGSESLLAKLRVMLNDVKLQPSKNVKRGMPCLALYSKDMLLYRGLITQVKEDKCDVYYIDYGHSEVLDMRFIFDISDDLLMINYVACRVCLDGAESLDAMDRVSVADAFKLLVASKTFKCQVTDCSRPLKVRLFNENHQNVRDLLVSMLTNPVSARKFDYSPSVHLAGVAPYRPRHLPPFSSAPTSAPRPTAFQLEPLRLESEEKLFVTCAQSTGRFFGQLERLPMDDLQQLQTELSQVYGQLAKPPLLYSDALSHVGDLGVVHWSEDSQYYRIRVHAEFVQDVVVRFVDYGNVLRTARHNVFAVVSHPTKLLARSPFGIFCTAAGVTLADDRWATLLADQSVHVLIGQRDNDDVYTVTFTNDPCNAPVIEALDQPSAGEAQQLDSSQQASISSLKLPDPSAPSSWITPPSNMIRLSEQPSAPIKNSAATLRLTPDPAKMGPSSATWETPLTGSRAPVQPCWDTPPANAARSSAFRDKLGHLNCNSQPKKLCWVTSPAETANGDWRRPGSRFGNSLQTSPSEDDESSLSSSKRDSFTSRASNDTNWRNSKTSEDQPLRKIPEATSSMPLSSVEPTYSPQRELTDSTATAQVVHVVSPVDFYCQLKESFDQLDALSSQLIAVYSDASKPSVANAKVGSACVARYVEDDAWFRGHILSIDGGQAKVFFVDYGNTQTSAVSELKAIEPDFLTLAPQAHRCRLSAVADRSWTDADRVQFEELCLERDLQFTFGGRCPDDGKYGVRLVESDGAGRLLNDLYGATSAATAAVAGPSPSPVPVFESDGVALDTPTEPIEVVVTWFYHSCRFYLAPAHLPPEHLARLEELESVYAALKPTELVVQEPRAGQWCVARFNDDGLFYRSRVVDVRDGQASLVFVDYGNTQRTAVAELKRLEPQFIDLPKLTFMCRLNGVRRVTPAVAGYQKFEAACFETGGKLTATFHPVDADGYYPVDLHVEKVGSAADFLVAKGVLEANPPQAQPQTSPEPAPQAPQLPQSIPDVVVEAAPPVQVASENLPARLDLSADELHNVYVSFVASADAFWLQLASDVNRIDDIQVELMKLDVDDSGKYAVREPTVGPVYAVLHPEYEAWYRAVLTSTASGTGRAHFIDYGDTRSISLSDVRLCPETVRDCPPLAFKCALKLNCASSAQADVKSRLAVALLRASVEEILGARLESERDDGVLLITSLCTPTQDLVRSVDEYVSQGSDDLRDESAIEDIVETSQLKSSTPRNKPLARCPEQPLEPKESEGQASIPAPEVDDSVSKLEAKPVEEPVATKEEEIYVSFVDSAVSFWAQRISDEKVINKIQEDLWQLADEESADNFLVAEPTVGPVYAVLHPEYETWYRAVLKSLTSDRAEAHFIDYGDSVSIRLCDVRLCPESVLSRPATAFQCALDLSPSARSMHRNAEVTELLAATSDQVLRAVFHDRLDDGVRLIRSLVMGDTDLVRTIEDMAGSACDRGVQSVDPSRAEDVDEAAGSDQALPPTEEPSPVELADPDVPSEAERFSQENVPLASPSDVAVLDERHPQEPFSGEPLFESLTEEHFSEEHVTVELASSTPFPEEDPNVEPSSGVPLSEEPLTEELALQDPSGELFSEEHPCGEPLAEAHPEESLPNVQPEEPFPAEHLSSEPLPEGDCCKESFPDPCVAKENLAEEWPVEGSTTAEPPSQETPTVELAAEGILSEEPFPEVSLIEEDFAGENVPLSDEPHLEDLGNVTLAQYGEPQLEEAQPEGAPLEECVDRELVLSEDAPLAVAEVDSGGCPAEAPCDEDQFADDDSTEDVPLGEFVDEASAVRVEELPVAEKVALMEKYIDRASSPTVIVLPGKETVLKRRGSFSSGRNSPSFLVAASDAFFAKANAGDDGRPPVEVAAFRSPQPTDEEFPVARVDEPKSATEKILVEVDPSIYGEVGDLSLEEKGAPSNTVDDMWFHSIDDATTPLLAAKLNGDHQTEQQRDRQMWMARNDILAKGQRFAAAIKGALKLDAEAKSVPLATVSGVDSPVEEAEELEATVAVAHALPPQNKAFTKNAIISSDAGLSYYVGGGHDFWLHLNHKTVEKMMEDIDEWVSRHPVAPPFRPEAGQLCLVNHAIVGNEPKMWYRAVVDFACKDLCNLTCVDFGFTCPAKVSELRPLPLVLADAPPLAVRCSLDGIERCEQDFEAGSIGDEFFALMPVAVQFKRVRAGKLSVRLFGRGGLDINVRMGLGADADTAKTQPDAALNVA